MLDVVRETSCRWIGWIWRAGCLQPSWVMHPGRHLAVRWRHRVGRGRRPENAIQFVCAWQLGNTEACGPLVGTLHTPVDELIENFFYRYDHFMELPSCTVTTATTAKRNHQDADCWECYTVATDVVAGNEGVCWSQVNPGLWITDLADVVGQLITHWVTDNWKPLPK